MMQAIVQIIGLWLIPGVLSMHVYRMTDQVSRGWFQTHFASGYQWFHFQEYQ